MLDHHIIIFNNLKCYFQYTHNKNTKLDQILIYEVQKHALLGPGSYSVAPI